MPNHIPADERRSSHRLPLNLLVQLRFHDMDELMREYASNISSGGMFIRTLKPHPVGSKVYIQFRLDDGQKVIDGLGEVVHINPADSPNPGMGVELINLDRESAEFIDNLVRERLSELEAADPPEP